MVRRIDEWVASSSVTGTNQVDTTLDGPSTSWNTNSSWTSSDGDTRSIDRSNHCNKGSGWHWTRTLWTFSTRVDHSSAHRLMCVCVSDDRFAWSLVFGMINRGRTRTMFIQFTFIRRQNLSLFTNADWCIFSTVRFFWYVPSMFVHCLFNLDDADNQCSCLSFVLIYCPRKRRSSSSDSRSSYRFCSSMDDLSLVVQSVIESELDDLLLELVCNIHSSLKGIPDDQLELTKHIGTRTRQLSLPSCWSANIAIGKQTCTCSHRGQCNIITIPFAYHLAKCLGKNQLKKEGERRTRLSHLVCLPLNVIHFRFDIECGIFIVDNDKFITQQTKWWGRIPSFEKTEKQEKKLFFHQRRILLARFIWWSSESGLANVSFHSVWQDYSASPSMVSFSLLSLFSCAVYRCHRRSSNDCRCSVVRSNWMSQRHHFIQLLWFAKHAEVNPNFC